MRLRATTACAALAIGAGALLVTSTGAGASAAGAKQAVQNALAASQTASSVHVVGSVTTGGQTTALNVQASNSKAGQGSVSINGAIVRIVRLGSRVYFNADAAFWTMEAGSSSAAFAGKWIYTSATGANGKNFSQFLGASGLFKQLLSGSKLNQSTFTQGANTTVAGVPVSAISGSDSTDGTSGVVYIARRGKPYLIELKTTTKSGTGELVFSAYNQPVHPKAPAHAISLTQLEQEAAAAG